MSFKNNEFQAEGFAGSIKAHVYFVEDDGEHKFWNASAFEAAEMVAETDSFATASGTKAKDAASQYAEKIAFERRDPFIRWLNTLIEEKEIDREQILEVEGASGINMMPLSYVLENIKWCPKKEQQGIQTMLVKIDFVNGDIVDYFKHLAQALAI